MPPTIVNFGWKEPLLSFVYNNMESSISQNNVKNEIGAKFPLFEPELSSIWDRKLAVYCGCFAIVLTTYGPKM